MRTRIVAIAAASLLAGAASAQQVYKCPGPNGPVFQQGPCDGAGSGRIEVKPANVLTDPDEGARIRLSTQRQANAAAARARGDVHEGASAAEVEALLGRPSRVNRRDGAGGVTEQWVFDGQDGTRRYVYVRDGKVSDSSTYSAGPAVTAQPCYSPTEIRNARVGAESRTLPDAERQRRAQAAAAMERCTK